MLHGADGASTLSWRTRLTRVQRRRPVSTSTRRQVARGQDRASRRSASTTISTLSSAELLQLLGQQLGLRRLERRTPSVTTRRSWRTSSESIERIAPRYILRLTFCAKSRGRAAKARPPPTQIGLRIEPARAGRVPFCVHAACGRRRALRRGVFWRLGAGAAGRHVGSDDLVDQGLVELAAEGLSRRPRGSAPPLATFSFMTILALLLAGLGQSALLASAARRLAAAPGAQP